MTIHIDDKELKRLIEEAASKAATAAANAAAKETAKETLNHILERYDLTPKATLGNNIHIDSYGGTLT